MNAIPHRVTALQFARYAMVGVASNALLFVLYLGMTSLGIGHKLAATLAYGVGVVQSFRFNKSWSFRNRGSVAPAFFRYIVAYVLGYILNIVLLLLFVDRLGFSHQWVQGLIIILLAVILFLLQKFWVFRECARGHS